MPANFYEQKLIRIWETVLGTQSIGVQDNFFECGGHSLLTVRLLTEIEQAFDRRLPLVTVFQAPTVRQMAQQLQQEQFTLFTEVTPAQQDARSSSQTLFWCAQNLGEVTALAKHLGQDQPFVYLDTGVLEIFSPTTHIRDRAVHCLQELKSVQPEGPYFLGGFCMGGLVAFEMALQLQAQGEEVALLALVESWLSSQTQTQPIVSPYSPYYRTVRRLYAQGRYLAGLKPANQLGYLLQQMKQFPALFSTAFRPEPLQQRVRREWEIRGHQAVCCYEPTCSYAGKVHFYFSQNKDRLSSLIAQAGWEKFVTDKARVQFLSGSHSSLIREPDVQRLADWLKADWQEIVDSSLYSPIYMKQ